MSELFAEISVILGLIVLNGLFAMFELAIVSSRRGRLEREAEAGSRGARLALALSDDSITFLATVQIGITLVGILAGVYAGATVADDLAKILAHISFIAPVAREVSSVILVILITYLSLTIGELLPKRIALGHPELIATALSPLFAFISRLLRPFVWILNASTQCLMRLLPFSSSDQSGVTEEDIKDLIEEGSDTGVIEESEASIVGRVFRLGDRTVGAIMTPRPQIEWLNLSEPPIQLLRQAISSPYSRFPVARDRFEDVLGIISVRDLAGVVSGVTGRGILEVLEDPLKIPGTTSALDLLERFKKEGKHIALVIDEYGGIDGIVTLHDLLEAMVGNLESEPDQNESIVVREDGSFLIDATQDIAEVLERLGIEDRVEVDRTMYHSLGGFILTHLGRIPKEGESFDFEGFRFEIVDMDRHRIDKILISPQSRS